MYNEEQKNRYIDYCLMEKDKGVEMTSTMFRKASDYEEMLGKDMCNFTVVDIMGFFSLHNTSSLGYMIVQKSCMNKYTEWCIANSLVVDSQNHYKEVSDEMLSSHVNRHEIYDKVLTYAELIRHLEILKNPSDKFIVLAIYEGVCKSNYLDLKNIELSDFDLENNTVKLHSGRVLKVSKRLINYAFESAETYTYDCYTDIDEEWIIEFRKNDNRIIKESRMRTAEDDEAHFRRGIIYRLSRIKSYVGHDGYVGKNLSNSGRINMIREIMIDGKYDNPFYAYTEHMDEVDYRYAHIASRPRYFEMYAECFKL